MGRAPSARLVLRRLALVLLLGACTVANPSVTPTPSPTRDPNALNVTALLDLSGSRTPNGSPQRDALQLWADQHSSGTPRVRLKIVDVASSPAKTALELRRAAVEDRADAIVMGAAIDYDDAFAAAVQLTHVPVIFTLPIPEPAARGGGGWAFGLAPTPAQLARVVLDDAAQRSVLASGLIVSDESTTAIAERIALVNELARRRVTPNVMTVTAADVTQRVRPLLATTSIVFLAGTPRTYLEAARTATVGTTLYLSYLCDFGDLGELRDMAPLAIWPGSRWIAMPPLGGSATARAIFIQTYTDRAGPPTSVAATAYDALALLSSAAEGGIDPVAVRDRLQSGTFAGVATTYTFSPGQHAGFNTSDLALLRYVGPRVAPAVR
jgi:ABC-type branched-subunit amino acid transport system substrate-binding protein